MSNSGYDSEHEAHYQFMEEQKYKKINSLALRNYAESLPNLGEAFHEDHSETASCIDEGVDGGKVRVAGSGILNPDGPEAVAKILLKAGITEVTSHEGCGAAALWTKANGGKDNEADKNGVKFSEEVARLMSEISGKEVRHRHIGKKEMIRPEEKHIARVAYYDATGRFNPAKVAELPMGFVVSGKYLEEKQAEHDTDLAVQIALGHHGLGKFFTKDRPFKIVVVADDEEKLNALEQQLEKIKDSYEGRVVIDGFVAPPAEAK